MLVLLACWASARTSIGALIGLIVSITASIKTPVALVLKTCVGSGISSVFLAVGLVLGMRNRAVATLIASGACVVMTIEATVSIWKRLSKDGSVLGLTFQQFFTWGFTDMGTGFFGLGNVSRSVKRGSEWCLIRLGPVLRLVVLPVTIVPPYIPCYEMRDFRSERKCSPSSPATYISR